MIVWNAQTGEEKRRLDGSWSSVNSAAFSLDSKAVACSCYDGKVLLWNIQGVQDEPERMIGTGHVETRAVAFSPDGKMIASGDSFGTILVWDRHMLRETLKLSGQSVAVNAIAFSPDGKTLASGGADGTVTLWDVRIGKEKVRLTRHSAWVSSLEFSPDGRNLASGSADGLVILWDVLTGAAAARLLCDDVGLILSLRFDPDHSHVCVAGTGELDENPKTEVLEVVRHD